jgi:hypothetical protein
MNDSAELFYRSRGLLWELPEFYADAADDAYFELKRIGPYEWILLKMLAGERWI